MFREISRLGNGNFRAANFSIDSLSFENKRRRPMLRLKTALARGLRRPLLPMRSHPVGWPALINYQRPALSPVNTGRILCFFWKAFGRAEENGADFSNPLRSYVKNYTKVVVLCQAPDGARRVPLMSKTV